MLLSLSLMYTSMYFIVDRTYVFITCICKRGRACIDVCTDVCTYLYCNISTHHPISLSLSLSRRFIETYRPDRASLDLNETDELEDSDSLKLTRESHPIERSRRYVRTYLT